MSSNEQAANPGAKAVEENLAGTRDEFNDAVTAQMLQEVAQDRADSESESESESESSHGDTERDSQPALETDEDSPATEGKAAS